MEVVRKDVVTAGGVQNQFIGVRVGKFLLRPDSDSGTRPDDLLVEGPSTTLLVEGGEAPLRVKLHSEGISRRGFQNRLSDKERNILSKLSSDLAGRIWPDAGGALHGQIEALGEDNVLQALQNLFKGVEGTMRGVRRCSFLPLVGKRLSEYLYPYIQN